MEYDEKLVDALKEALAQAEEAMLCAVDKGYPYEEFRDVLAMIDPMLSKNRSSEPGPNK
jgi:hypothetical protein